ncbi:hypothetical protein [Pseudarthrobacter niigatensis]|uniref:Uncharacterized protein n=1 Tax=Pseudarthrobacter niigatensis TaxID=369935 RepID=A0AAJ1SU83_9MICC|nr:hypothetical protein [Pseudarthrobacter niigatensis]MDQ0145868.1 hypothetical protein [Pseudarthrobacter niigatensis]MDQ0265722.1 hypothetical protein [Pseudarthrobacter niigatensis]
MEQQHSGALGFREADTHGQPVAPEADGAEPAGTPRSWPAPNPFIVALWLLCAAMIAGGASALLNNPMSVSMGDRATFDYLVFAFAPQGISGGIAVLIALLFWHAWTWQRRRGWNRR